MTDLRVAGPDDVDDVAHLIGRSFAHLDMTAWMIPDRPEPERGAILGGQFEILVEHVVEHGIVDVASTGGVIVGAAVWRPVTADTPAIRDYDDRLAAVVAPRYLDRFRIVDAAFAGARDAVAVPFWHLALLAVLPEHRGNGIGGALLRHHLGRDAPGPAPRDTPAFLEASNPGAARLYARHGFTGDGPSRFADGGTEWWPLLRPAGPPA